VAGVRGEKGRRQLRLMRHDSCVHRHLPWTARVNPSSVPLYAGFLGLSLAALLAGAAGASRRIRGIRRI
jgi:hypothetical protein